MISRISPINLKIMHYIITYFIRNINLVKFNLNTSTVQALLSNRALGFS